ncbi:suppressor of cytokine signaling 7 isoform X2 [Heptranchias perlo]|uniref:suppressor of cytokine signaling 7 isoform X2 n=1 Tax=Heptranchias perlo TaxID=212740 RepID=UPI003559B0CF
MMNPQAASDFVLLHVIAPDFEERSESGSGSGTGSGAGAGVGVKAKSLPFDVSRRPAGLLQDASCKLQHFDFPGTKGSRPQLMVFRNLVRAEDGLGPGPGPGPGAEREEGTRGGNGGEGCRPCRGFDLLAAAASSSSSSTTTTGGLGGGVEGLDPCRARVTYPRVKLAPSPPSSPGLCPRHRGGCCCCYPSPGSGSGAAADRLPDTGWGEGRVFELARDFGDFTVGSGRGGGGGKWSEEPGCECSGLGASNSPHRLAEDPTETSDAVLVLEGIEPGDAGLESLDINGCLDTCEEDTGSPSRASPDSQINIFCNNLSELKAQGMSGDCQMYRDQRALASDLDPQGNSNKGRERRLWTEGSGTQCDLSNVALDTDSSFELSSSPQQKEDSDTSDLPKVRVGRCASSPSTGSLASLRDGDDKLSWRLPGKSRKSSLKNRLSKLFRTKSCNGSSNPGAKRHSMDLETSSGCLVEMSKLQEGYDMRSKPRLTRTQSAFTPVSLAPPFTDDIAGPQPPSYPVSPAAAASLQSLPLPPPPPPHTAIQQSLGLNETLLRTSPLIRPMAVQLQHCALNRRDSNSFAASLRELEKCGWYWGPMNWDDAEMKLKGKPDGSFLVRDSSDPRYILSLSFRSQGITHHTRMEHYRGTFSLWCHPKFEDRCQSVVEFIERAIMHSKNGKFLYFLRSRVPGLPPTPVQLLYPVSRFSNVKSLQHLCRFRIRQLVRIDHIPELPLPKPLISYLRKFYYYDPEEETYLSLKEARLSIAHEQDMDTQT